MSYKIHKQYRLRGHDYSRLGHYFVTICTKDRELFFGKIKNTKMILSPIGKIVQNFWIKIPEHFKNIHLDEWIIMPNHIHGIIEIEREMQGRNAPRRVLVGNPITHENAPRRVPTLGNTFGPLPKNSLSSIINHFKGNVKKHCNRNGFEFFTWQPRFYDRIIRDEQGLFNARQYIINNPGKWGRDRNNEEGLGM